MSASVVVQRLRPHSHIDPDATGWRIGLGGSVPVGMGQFETGKVQGGMVSSIFPLLFGPCVEFDFHNKALKFVRFAHWDLRSFAAPAP